MRLKKFESFDADKDTESKFERNPREREKSKRCIGKCDRQLVVKEGEIVIQCSACDRIIKPI